MSLSILIGLALGQNFGGIINPYATAPWSQYGGNPQHTSLSTIPGGPIQTIKWSAPVDLNPQYSGGDLLIHYGTPTITSKGTVIVPTKTGATGGFVFAAYSLDSHLKWVLGTDYTLPPHGWTPSCAGALNLGSAWYMVPGIAGTLWQLITPDNPPPSTMPVQLAFYGLSLYTGATMADKTLLQNNVKICSPLTVSMDSRLYYGFRVLGPLPIPTHFPPRLKSGLVQAYPTAIGGTWVSAVDATGDSNMTGPVMNCAPAVSKDGKFVYWVVSANGGYGYLVCTETHNMTTVGMVRLKDPGGNDALLSDDGTASPMIGPDGDVYMGVLENPFPYNHDRGWMLHFNAALTVQKPTGAFGWDDTASVVPSKAVPSYFGTSPYLLLTKYNNYAGVGGDGVNKVAILDPNQTQVDLITGHTVMKEVMTITGPTPDPQFRPSHPNAVREWCINAAVIDPYNKCAIINSEDGTCYRWNLVTGTLDQSVSLTAGVGEAYTPTLIGPNGTSFAINNAMLFALGGP